MTTKTIRKSATKLRKLLKKRNDFETKFAENIGKPKELWKTLKAFGLPNEVSIVTINAPRDNKVVIYDLKFISEVFQTFFDNLAETLLQKLPPPPNKLIQ